MPPLVAVVTLTVPGREEFLELRRKEVKRQSYARIVHIVVHGPGIKGAMRNEGARLAIEAGAEIIVNADDDDMLLSTGVERRVKALVDGAELCGTSRWYSYDMRGGYGVLSETKILVHDASLAYWTRVWKECQFDSEMKKSEGAMWMRNFRGRIHDLKDLNVFVYMLHGKNYLANGRLSRKYKLDTTQEVHVLMGDDLPWYLARQEESYQVDPEALTELPAEEDQDNRVVLEASAEEIIAAFENWPLQLPRKAVGDG